MTIAFTTPKEAVGVMLRVIFALTLRETHNRYGQLKIGYLWALIEPMLFIVILAFIFSYARQLNSGPMPPILFYTTGILPFFLFRDTFMRTMTAVQSNIQLLTFPQVHIFELTMARALLELVNVTIVFTVLISIILLTQLEPVHIDDWVSLLLATLSLSLLGFGAGTAFSALLPLFPSIGYLGSAILIRPLFFISGVFFTVEVFPSDLRAYAMLNPVLQLIEQFRSAFFREYQSEHVNMLYATGFTLTVLFLGLLLQRALRRYATRTP